jgi:hypothetical protein
VKLTIADAQLRIVELASGGTLQSPGTALSGALRTPRDSKQTKDSAIHFGTGRIVSIDTFGTPWMTS